MLTSLHIQNFKGIQDLYMDDLKQVTLVGGKNNVGKSSLLEAVFLLFNALNADMFYRQYTLRNVENVLLNDITGWRNYFYMLDEKIPIVIEARTKDGRQSNLTCKFDAAYSAFVPSQAGMIRDNNGLMGAMEILFEQDGILTYHAHIYGNNLLDVHVNQIAQGRAQDSAIIVPTGFNKFLDTRILSRLEVDNQTDLLVKALQAIEPAVRDLTIIQQGSRPEVYADIGVGKKMPLHLMGDGLVHLLSYLLSIASAHDGIVMIDEVENGLHHLVREDVWRVLLSAAQIFNCQILATTHSYGCVEAAYDACNTQPDSFVYARMEAENEQVGIKKFSLEQLKLALDMNMEVR